MLFNDLRKLKADAKKIHLTPDEKNSMDKAILGFMQKNPLQSVRIEKDARHTVYGQTVIFSFLHKKYMFASLVVLLVVALGGGVSYAAEGTVPGQPLYPVKHLTEEVKAAITFSPKADAEWDTRRVERRLEEATVLASQGKLESTVQEQLSNDLKIQVQKTQKEIKNLEKNGNIEAAADLSARLQTALSVHESILTSLEERIEHANDSQRKETEDDNDERGQEHSTSTVATTSTLSIRRLLPAKLLEQLKTDTNSAGAIKIEIEDKIKAQVNTEAAASAKISSAKNKIAEVRKFLAEKENNLSADAKQKAEAQLTKVDTLLTDAQTKFTAKDYQGAFVLAAKAHEQAQEVKLIIMAQQSVQGKLDIKNILEKRNEVEQKIRERIELNRKENTEKKERENENEKKEEHKSIELKLNSSGSIQL